MAKKKKQPAKELPENELVLDEPEVELEESQVEEEDPQDTEEVDEDMEETEKPEKDPDFEYSEEELNKLNEEAIKRAVEQKDKETNAAESKERLRKAETLFTYAKDARRRYDREWLSRDLFRRGYQFVTQNIKTGTIAVTGSQRARIPVNLTWAYIRSIKNQVTSFNPKWEVLPEFKGKRSEENARLTGKLLDYLYKKMNLNKMIKEAVIQGLIYSIGGPFEVVWNPTYDNGPNQPRGEVEIILHDPYDVYFDPNATSMDDCNYLIKSVLTSVDEVRKNENYDKTVRESIKGGSPTKAESEYKQFLIQTVQNSASPSLEDESVLVREIQQKERDEDGNIKIRYLTWTDNIDRPLRDELVDQEWFDMEVFQADMNPLEMYGDSWSKHVIALNRVINALESSVFMFNYKFAKGRLVIDKNAGVKSVTNEHGSIIEKNRGATVTTLPMQNLPNTVEGQILRLKAFMEDISGVHDPSLGRAPTSIKSGIGIAELKQSDSQNHDDLVQNLEVTLRRLGQKILKKIAKYYDTPRIVKVVGTGRMIEHFAVVGEDYVDEEKEEWKIKDEKYPLTKIGYNNELDVQIGSWLAYSKEGRQKLLMDLAEAGVISKEHVLKFFEFPNIQEITDSLRAEATIEMKRKESKEMPSAIADERLAVAENEMMLEGSPMPVDPEKDDHELHVAIHSRELGQDDNHTIADHIKEHRRAQKGGGEALPLQTQAAPPTQTPAPPGIPQGGVPLNGQMAVPVPEGTPGSIPGPIPQQPPEASFFSAGVTELPPTAGAILGGPANPLPVA